ncbi:MAG: hypothetical protein EOO90_03965 [Pedobacter sp.]|nr:MAG: hypothetical protein EOO90_03965 [Pedobacter sp.]
MRNRTTIKTALIVLTSINTIHFASIIKVIPAHAHFGRQIEDDWEIYFTEGLSILINLSLTFTLLMKGKFARTRFKERIIDRMLWVFLAIFVWSTISTLFAQTQLEKLLAVLTLILTLLIWSVLKKKNRFIRRRNMNHLNQL